MLHIVKTTNLMIKRTSFLCGLVFAAVVALLPISAHAQCSNWDASGVSEFRQHDQVNPILVKLEQKGRVLTGSAQFDAHGSKAFSSVKVTGTVDGTIEGDRFSVQIFWPDGLTGVYNAKVLPSGRLDGETYDKNHSNIRDTWSSGGVLKCLPIGPSKPFKITSQITLPPSPKPPPPTPIRSSGKMPKSEPAPPPPPPMKVPGIIAGQVIYISPYDPRGLVVLQWDAGPDHPYAEVWFKVNNGEEVRLLEKGKGAYQVTVQRGWYYEYILTDDGTTLATVTFVAH
jgi:hypothetical protein